MCRQMCGEGEGAVRYSPHLYPYRASTVLEVDLIALGVDTNFFEARYDSLPDVAVARDV